MITKKIIPIVIIFIFMLAGNTKRGYTQVQDERISISAKELIERLTRIEETQKSLQRQIDDNYKSLQQQIGGSDKRIDDLKTDMRDLKADIRELKSFVTWGFGMMWMGMLALFGFVVWDRRTALLPTIHELKELALREKKVETALQQYATKEIRFAQAMQAAGLL